MLRYIVAAEARTPVACWLADDRLASDGRPLSVANMLLDVFQILGGNVCDALRAIKLYPFAVIQSLDLR